MNRLFVLKKPLFVSSNNYINRVKRELKIKKIGYSGTLDPFAKGVLIAATGQFTKLFPYLKKEPKVYRATLWFGAVSKSLDIENIVSISNVKEFDLNNIAKVLNSLKGKISYTPPSFSAKKIGGIKAYELARENKEVNLKTITSTIFDIKLINYNHPFLHFEISVSEGAYIRSIAQIIANRLNTFATLSSLERISEGNFKFDNLKPINPYENLKIQNNKFLGDYKEIELGKKLKIEQFSIQKDGIYLVESKNFYSIIQINKGTIKYKLNRLSKEWC
jgi:tRNA pseudouridine55 synthase